MRALSQRLPLSRWPASASSSRSPPRPNRSSSCPATTWPPGCFRTCWPASFLATHWAAYRDTPVGTDDHARLVGQMRALLTQEASFRNASPLEQQALYELLAIAGMRMAVAHQALQQHPDAAARLRLRQAAGTALGQLLGADPERLRWSADGLQLAAAKAP